MSIRLSFAALISCFATIYPMLAQPDFPLQRVGQEVGECLMQRGYQGVNACYYAPITEAYSGDLSQAAYDSLGSLVYRWVKQQESFAKLPYFLELSGLPKQAIEEFDKAESAWIEENRRAAKRFRKLIQEYPRFQEAKYYYAETLLKVGDLENVLQYLEVPIQQFNHDVPSPGLNYHGGWVLSWAYLALEKYALAERVAKEVLKMNEYSPEARYVLFEVALVQEEYAQAAESLIQAYDNHYSDDTRWRSGFPIDDQRVREFHHFLEENGTLHLLEEASEKLHFDTTLHRILHPED